MKTIAIMVLTVGTLLSQGPDKPIVTGFPRPFSPCYGPNGHLYVSDPGLVEAGDGKIYRVENGKPEPFATGLENPTGMVYLRAQNAFFVIDTMRIMKVDSNGKASVHTAATKFPGAMKLCDIAVEDTTQSLLVSTMGDGTKGNGVYRIDIRKGTVESIVTDESFPKLFSVHGVAFDGITHAIISTGDSLIRVNMSDRTSLKIAEGFDGATSLVWDHYGRLFILTRTGIFAIPKPGEQAVLLHKVITLGDACLDATGQNLLYTRAGDGLYSHPSSIPGWEVDETPLNVEFKPAFPKLTWIGWDDGSDTGKVNEHRPVWLTHANDGSNRIFVLLQQGTVHIIDDKNAAKSKVFLDITKKVRFLKNQNEEGLLGMAFHPDYKKNGEIFVFYTDATAKLTNIISRFKVKADNPNEADPASEEVILKIEKPYWNHDGGTIIFGPDGYLYFTHGDGGLANDPHENGQNLKAMLGKVLRIDVNKKENGKNYGIPADNPFVNNKDALPEIYANGVRNLWRMAFDRKTGKLWAGEVGQNLYEEINIIEKGGNYGWNLRESLHPFGKKGVDARKDLIEPIWEYHHDIGKSITGGHVYRGKAIPELNGMYLYADYVTPKLWALKYDEAKKRVTGNHVLGVPDIAVMSFGEDEKGESYIMGATPNGQGIYKLVKK